MTLLTANPVFLAPSGPRFRPLAAPVGQLRTEGAGVAAQSATAGAGARADQAAREMEGLFLKLLCQEMWRTTGSGQGAFLPQGLAGDIYRDFLTEAYAGKMAEAGGLGLSRLIVNHLDR